MYKRILVPFDASDTSRKALVAALQLAREAAGRVRIVHALDELAFLSAEGFSLEALEVARAWAEQCLRDGMDIAKAAGIPADSKLLDARGERLGELVAQEALAFEADLVAVGTHGRRGIDRVLLGSGAEQIIRMAPIPVLVVRTPQLAFS